MTPSDKLLAAARLLDEVRAELNVKSAKCPCCGLDVKDDWSQAQLASSLQSTAGKIRRYADLVPPASV